MDRVPRGSRPAHQTDSRRASALAGLLALVVGVSPLLVGTLRAEEPEPDPCPLESEAVDHMAEEFALLPEAAWGTLPWGDGTFLGDEPLVAEVSARTDGERTTVTVPVLPFSTVFLELEAESGEIPLVLAVRDEFGARLSSGARKRGGRRSRGDRFSVGGSSSVDVVVTTTGTPSDFRIVARSVPDPFADWDDIIEFPTPAPDVEDQLWRADRLVVCTEPGLDAEAALSGTGLEFRPLFGNLGTIEAEGAGYELADWLENGIPGFLCVEPEGRASLPDGSQANGIVLGSRFGRKLDRQPALNRVKAAPAHRRADGSGVVVAVLDTGVDASHPDLQGRVLPGMDFVDEDADPSEERDWIDDDDDGRVDEGYGHGTVVAGLVLLTAPDAFVLPVRVLDDDGRGTAASVAAGIHYAVHQGADVINLSLGMRVYSEILADAVRFARSQGVVVVAATGNDGRRALVDFPASEPGVVPVRALGAGGRRADFANGARSRTVSAPGRNLRATAPEGTYAKATGTSFSAALVSGGAALYLSRNPRASGVVVERALLANWRLNLSKLTR